MAQRFTIVLAGPTWNDHHVGRLKVTSQGGYSGDVLGPDYASEDDAVAMRWAMVDAGLTTPAAVRLARILLHRGRSEARGAFV